MNNELFPIVDVNGNVIGKSSRQECHSGSMILHPVVHLHILRSGGYIYLQKRSMNKDIQPGKWDTAVGGHVDYGETIEEALRREVHEELGFSGFTPQKICSYIFESVIERELVNTFMLYVDDTFSPITAPDEISESRFWHVDEVMAAIGKEILTPNFEQEFRIIKEFIK